MKIAKKLFSILLCILIVIPNVVTVRAATNLAYGKTTFASSMYDEAGNYSPDKVTDGDYNNIWSMGSVTLLGRRGGVDQYIAVDLGEAYMLDSIVAASRRGLDDAEARTGWYAQVANDEHFSDAITIKAAYNTVAYEGDYKFFCDLDKPYRYVRICSPAYFTVAEIEVYGEKYDPTTMNRKVAFTDVENEFYQSGAMLCSALNIMTGISKTEFAGEKILTRAQAAKIMTLFLQMKIEKADKQIFADVPSDHWAADYIYTATKANIISVDENFRPEDFVTDKEFLKLVLYAMGYGEYVEYSGGWENGIYYVSDSLSLTKKARAVKGQNLSRGSAAMILFNALNSKPQKTQFYVNGESQYVGATDETMLEKKFGLTIVTGLMRENSTTSLVSPTNSGAGNVTIGKHIYRDADQIMERWIGRNVGIAVDVETETVISAAWCDTSDEIITVNDFQREYVDENIYEYEDENGNIKKLKINEEMFLIKNNSAILDWTPDDLVCPDGYIEFINNDYDDEFEVAVCYEPQVMIVSYISNDSGKVSIASIDGTMIQGEDLSYLSITKNGKNTTAGRIVSNDIVKVYKSSCGNSIWIDAGEDRRIAKVESLHADKVKIDGDFVEFTEFYKNNKEKADSIVLGNTMEFLLDDMGRIAWVMQDDSAKNGETIGYIIKVSSYIDETDENPLKIKFYTEKGTFGTYYAAENIRLDGVRYEVDKVCEMVNNGSLDIEGEFAMFKLDKDDFITHLDTEEIGEERNSKIIPLTDDSGRKVSFVAHNGTFGNIHNYPDGEGIYEDTYLQQPLKRDTLAFIIPIDSNNEPLDNEYEELYGISTAEHTWTTLNPISERTEFYGLDDNNYPAFGVRYRVYAGRSQSGVRAIDNNAAAGMVVTNVREVLNEDGEIIKEIAGYSIGNGREAIIKVNDNLTRFIESGRIQQEKSEWIDDGTKYLSLPVPTEDQAEFETYCKDIDELKSGDIILYLISGTYVSALERVFSIDDVDYSTYSSNKGSYYTSGSRTAYPDTMGANFKLMYGKVTGINDGVVKYQNVPEDDPDAKFPMHIQYANMSAIFIVKGDKVTVESASNLPAYVSVNDETEMVVHTSTGNFRSAVIYK